ncbi:3-dehydroquinate synthase [Paenibacillus spiritus]|uniref:3-dehydroquinate synthase n=1 Tax=Paenibacillus spiritus TaxID=2496557 RepID=A0A5J5GEN3_9BACL|nr:3-dehydroquinate synthase [Paenibacillus spiritus]KAA9006242.1 3-dehydroquinate synthase [Paenibacillus spiritus]
MRTLKVDLGDRSYPIHIGPGLLPEVGRLCREAGFPLQSPLLIVTDSEVGPLYLDRVASSLADEGFRTVVHTIPSGEASKSLENFEAIMTTAITGGLDRSSAVLALGGGVVGDLAGFVAASYMRGIAFVQLPTTVLAHDSSVGGKVAINHPLAKNMIGAFHQPKMVVYDLDALKTLPKRQILSGLAEVVKQGLMIDPEFVTWLEEHAEGLVALRPDLIGEALEHSCAIKVGVVTQDEREFGIRAILNLGHTLGHAIEAVGGYGTFLHGEAISIGMAGSALLAVKLGRDRAIYTDTIRVLKAFGLPTVLPDRYSEDELIEAMMHDKKFKQGKVTFILPESIGSVSIVEGIEESAVREVIGQLKKGDSPW